MIRKMGMFLLVCCLAVSLLACGKKTGDDGIAAQTQAQMTWQEQYDLGIRLLNEGKYEDAILAFQAAISIDPKRADAYVSLADAYVQAGNRDGAVDVLQDGLDHADDVNWIKDAAFGLGFYIDENGQVISMTEEESIAESLGALSVEEQLEYYTKQASQEWQGCFEDNILRFGQDVRTITLEQLREEAQQKEWASAEMKEVSSAIYFNSGSIRDTVSAWLHDYGVGIVGFTRMERGYQSNDYAERDDFRNPIERGEEIGILDLYMGDSFEEVLTKLGVPYASEITSCVLQWTNTEETDVTTDGFIIRTPYNSETQVDGMKTGEDIVIWYSNRGPEVNGSIQDAIYIKHYVRYWRGGGSSVQFAFYGPEYELWFYEIHN